MKEKIIIDKDNWTKVDAQSVHYKELNLIVRDLVSQGIKKIELQNVCGQRYIGTNLYGLDAVDLEIKIYGTPGNDLGTFLNGPKIEVFGNVQDGCGNTMNDGEIIVHGSAGDILGYGMRGGKIFIQGRVGYRVAIHMKEYKEKIPVIVIGETMQDFFGEYMAGGRVIVLALNLEEEKNHRPGYFVGTGMHGGAIFIRGKMDEFQLGKEVGVVEPDNQENDFLRKYLEEFFSHFNYPLEKILSKEVISSQFIKLYPKYLRPYGRLYTY